MNIEALKKLREQVESCYLLLTDPSLREMRERMDSGSKTFVFVTATETHWFDLETLQWGIRFLELTIEDETNKARLKL